MSAKAGRTMILMAMACCLAPAVAHADAAWTCGAGAGWVAVPGQRADAPTLGGEPCATSQADPGAASGAAGNLSASGMASVDGGSAGQTTDARTPRATVQAKSLTIQSPDGKLTLTASNLTAAATASCDASRQPTFAGSGGPGSVTLNGRPIDTGSDYSEPGVGVNGAPLLGKITIHFNEVAKTADGLTRRAIHLIVTDKSGATVFESVAGQVSVGRDGAVCDPPPVCPPGQEPQADRCVDVTVTPLPQPPPPTPALPSNPITGGGHGTHNACADAGARASKVSTKRLARATLCLMNAERSAHHAGKLRASADLARAAQRHGHDMVARGYFSHTEPGGASLLDRILHSGYLGRYGRWSIGENLGWGWGSGTTPRSMVNAWMHSPEHRRNLLDRGFHDVGVAVLKGSPARARQGGGVTYVIDFGGFKRA
jgi:uncharacterized protein YkwD